MSGGHFDYKQYHINEIVDSIEREVNYPPTAKLMGWASDFTDS